MKDLREFNEAMRACSNVEYRDHMHMISEYCVLYTEAFFMNPTSENLRNLNGMWALAARLLKHLPPTGAPAPLGGDTEPARLAA